MSDDTLTYEPNPEATDAPSGSFGTFAEDGTYTPRQITADDLGGSFEDAIDGTLVSVEGQGTFDGPTGGTSDLRVRYERPRTQLRLQDSAPGLDLRATSVLPAITPDPTVAAGVAFGRLNRQPVLVLWVIRDVG